MASWHMHAHDIQQT